MSLKSILSITALISFSFLLFSCGHGMCVCSCSTAAGSTGQKFQNYNVGNISLNDGTVKCNALKSQNGWDTCLAHVEMP